MLTKIIQKPAYTGISKNATSVNRPLPADPAPKNPSESFTLSAAAFQKITPELTPSSPQQNTVDIESKLRKHDFHTAQTQGAPVTLLAAPPSLPQASAPVKQTEGSKLRRIASDSNIRETLPHQTRGRAPWTYALMLGSEFSDFVAERSESTKPWKWLDAGSGVSNVAAAVMARGAAGLVKPTYNSGEFIYKHGEPDKNLSVTLVDLDTPVQSDSRTTVHTGRKIEEIPGNELGQHDLLTDIQGPIAYSDRPDLVLNKYLDALKDDGKLFLSMGSNQDPDGPFGETNRVVGRDGVARNYIDWMRSIPGLRVKVHESTKKSEMSEVRAVALEIQKEPGKAVQIPELQEAPVFLKPGGPPRMVLREKTDFHFAEAFAVGEARNATRLAMQEVTLQESGPEMIEKFKGGLLRSALRKVPDGEWVHLSKVSPQVEAAIASPQEDERLELGGIFGSRSPVGKVVENPSDLQPNRSFRLISDDGPLSWSYRPDRTLKSYLEALSDDGEILVNLGDEARGQGLRTSVFSQGGEEFSLANWLRRANGLDVEIHEKWGDRPQDDQRFAQIRIKDRAKIDIPELQILAVDAPIDDGTHSVMLQEKSDFEPKLSMLRRVSKQLGLFWKNYLS